MDLTKEERVSVSISIGRKCLPRDTPVWLTCGRISSSCMTILPSWRRNHLSLSIVDPHVPIGGADAQKYGPRGERILSQVGD